MTSKLFDQREDLYAANRTTVAPNCDGFYERNPHQDEADRHGVPLIPKIPPQREINPIIAICGECGRQVHQVECYYCGLQNCPIQKSSSVACSGN